MRRIDKQLATEALATYVDGSDHETLIVTEGGQPVAALVPLVNTGWETVSLSMNARFLSIIERSRQRQREEGGWSLEAVRQHFQRDTRATTSTDSERDAG